MVANCPENSDTSRDVTEFDSLAARQNYNVNDPNGVIDTSKSRSARLASQLGMPHGTAANKLRKNIMFHLLKKLTENICFVCHFRIEKVEDLSIEHKEPWEGRSVELYWSLDNIAFSHLKCNRQHAFVGGIGRRIKSPDGMNWCRTHKQYLPVDRFSTQPSRWNGLCFDCRDCTNATKRGSRKSPKI